MEKIIDLHIHSNYSDGVLTPYEIIDKACLNNVSVISICDHDNIDCYSDKLFDYADKHNIKLIPGIEISTKWNGVGIHILGYNIDINNKKLRDKVFKLKNVRHDYLFNVTSKLNSLGYNINTSYLDTIDSVTKAHIARDVVDNIDNKELLIDTFGYIPSYGEFIERIMNEGCPCYVVKESITPKEAAVIIREATGIPVLAHPVAHTYEDNLSEEDILKLIRECAIDFIEANYIYINRSLGNAKVNDIDKWIEFAKNNSLKYTVGSDYHFSDSVSPEIGLSKQDVFYDNDYVDDLLNSLGIIE